MPCLGLCCREPEPSPGPIPTHLWEPLVRSFNKDHFVDDEGDIVFYQVRWGLRLVTLGRDWDALCVASPPPQAALLREGMPHAAPLLPWTYVLLHSARAARPRADQVQVNWVTRRGSLLVLLLLGRQLGPYAQPGPPPQHLKTAI